MSVTDNATYRVEGGPSKPSHITNNLLPPLSGTSPTGAAVGLALTPEGMLAVLAGAPTSYRSGLIAADVLAPPGSLTTSVVNGGSLTNGQTYNSKVVAGNTYGRTTATAGTARAASTPNLTLRIAIPQVTDATFYDIYVSTDTDPKWVGRITEAQRASGIKITAVGVTGAGGTAGAVDVEVAGTGLQAATTAATNTAYSIPAPLIDCSAHQYVDVDIEAARTGDAVAASLVLLPMFKNTRETLYYASSPIVLNFGGQSGLYQSMRQRVRIECRDTDMVILVAAIGGTGMTVDMDYTLC